MFKIFVKSIIIQNYEYDLIENCKDIEQAKQYSYIHNYQIIVHFILENMYWVSKITTTSFEFAETNGYCDTYILNNIDDCKSNILISSAQKIYNKKNCILLVGSLENFTNYDFINSVNSNEYDLVGIIKNDNHIYLTEKMGFNMMFLVENDSELLNLVHDYMTIIENIKLQKYRYITALSTSVILNDYATVEKIILKLKSLEIEAVYTNNLNKMFICKNETVDSVLENNNVVNFLKINEIVINND